jgi:hypothetical protein
MEHPDLFSVGDDDALPYAGTAGAVNQPASTQRAHDEARSGAAKARASKVLDLLNRNADGLTYQEVGEHLALHHGQSSGALSTLHKAGLVFMTFERRNRCQVYVHARFRDRYAAQERIDEPAQTKAGKRKEQFEQLLQAVTVGITMGRIQDSEVIRIVNHLKETE